MRVIVLKEMAFAYPQLIEVGSLMKAEELAEQIKAEGVFHVSILVPFGGWSRVKPTQLEGEPPAIGIEEGMVMLEEAKKRARGWTAENEEVLVREDTETLLKLDAIEGGKSSALKRQVLRARAEIDQPIIVTKYKKGDG
jgi:hypothetical protein